MVWEELVIEGRIGGGGCAGFRRYEVSAGVSRPHSFTEKLEWIPALWIQLLQLPLDLKSHVPFVLIFLWIDWLHLYATHKQYYSSSKPFTITWQVIHVCMYTHIYSLELIWLTVAVDGGPFIDLQCWSWRPQADFIGPTNTNELKHDVLVSV